MATAEKSETQYTESLVGEDVEKGGTLNLGLNAVAGVDYYVAQHLYMGTEIGFGVGFNKDLTKKVTAQTLNQDGNGLVSTDTDSKAGTESSLQVGPNVIGQIRLGWVF